MLAEGVGRARAGRTGPAGSGCDDFGYSDWSTQNFDAQARELWLRVRRKADDSVVEASTDGARWTQVRMTHLHEGRGAAAVDCGVYACSPKGAGFVAEFDQFSLRSGRVG